LRRPNVNCGSSAPLRFVGQQTFEQHFVSAGITRGLYDRFGDFFNAPGALRYVRTTLRPIIRDAAFYGLEQQAIAGNCPSLTEPE